MGEIYGICGHIITDFKLVAEGLKLQDYDRECQRAISIVVYCRSCKDRAEKDGRVIHNQEEEDAWFQGQ